MSPETLQRDMFTGEMVDNRTAAQKRTDHERDIPMQRQMFSLQETVQIDVSAYPWLSETSRPTLELVSEDPRTPEEIERDLMREAEALTNNLFPDLLHSTREEEPEGELELDDSQEPPDKPVDGEKVSKISAYRALVTLVREQAITLWVDSAYRQRYYNQLPLTMQAAQDAGLTASEISAAMQIGEFLGNQERQVANSSSHVIYDAESANETSSKEAGKSEPQPPAIEGVARHEGLRAQLHREGIAIRTRQPKSKIPEIVPIEWMEREHIQKRLPYLAEGIARLDEEELLSLAESISEVLKETYWIILGITLSHYFDREQEEKTI
jgi:hypothetical protein